MRVAQQLFQEHFQVPNDWVALPTYKLFEKIGLVAFHQAGLPTFLPVGQRLVNAVGSLIREEAARGGFEEIYFPLIQDAALLEKTGRAGRFSNEFYRLPGNLILTPTNEEVYCDLASRTDISYRQLPIRMFQIADKFRNITRPKGIFRSKEFLMCDMVSIDMNETMLYESAEVFEQIAKAVFSRLEITISRVQKNNGRYVDFVVECPEGNLHIGHMRDRYEKGGVPASSVGMYFLSVDSGPEFRTTDNEVTPSCLGSYGFGIQRCIHAVIEQHRDGLGIAFPQAVRPFDSAVILLDPADQQQRTLAEECYRTLYNNGGKPLFDDRRGKLIKEKTALADFFGIPFKLIIGRREASNKTVTVKWRNGSEEQVYPASDTLLKLLHT